MSPRNCSACGEAFEPTRADAQYCSDTCRQRARRKRVTDNGGGVTDNPVTDNRDALGAPVTDNRDDTAADEPRDTAHASSSPPPPEVPTRNDQVMAALEVLAAQAPERAAQAREDLQKLQAKWSEEQRADWRPVQEARLAWELRGREASSITSAQAVVRNKVIYRHQLGARNEQSC